MMMYLVVSLRQMAGAIRSELLGGGPGGEGGGRLGRAGRHAAVRQRQALLLHASKPAQTVCIAIALRSENFSDYLPATSQYCLAIFIGMDFSKPDIFSY